MQSKLQIILHSDKAIGGPQIVVSLCCQDHYCTALALQCTQDHRMDMAQKYSSTEPVGKLLTKKISNYVV